MYYEGKEVTVLSVVEFIQVVLENNEDVFLKSEYNYSNCIQAIVIDQIIDNTDKIGKSLINYPDVIQYEKAMENLRDRKEKLIKQRRSGYPKCKLFFRGQSNYYYNLLPGIWRENGINNEIRFEDYYYRQIEVLCPNEFKDKNHLEHLTTMQHYHCRTRLLDVTTNPLVALYFACQYHEIDDKPGKVSVFAPRETDVLNFDSDKAMMLSCLAKFSENEKKKIYEEAVECIKANKKLTDKRKKPIEKLYHEVQSEKPAFERNINPLDLLTPFFVQPICNNQRIAKQSGAFIICGLNKNASDARNLLNELVVKEIVIEPQYKKAILNDLDRLGVNKAALFPEIDNVAEYLTSSKKVEWNDSQ